MKRLLFATLIFGICAQYVQAEDVTGTPLSADELKRLQHEFETLREYGLTDPHIRYHNVWYRVSVDLGTYGLVFGARDVFVGVIQNIGEEQWRFIPYSGKKRFYHRHAVALAKLPDDELALWFRPHEEMLRVESRIRGSGSLITEIHEAESRGQVHKYIRDIWPDPTRITFSMKENIFTDEDVIAVQTPSGTFYPEYNFEASRADRLDFVGLWKHDPNQQWTRHEFLTYAELVDWNMEENGAVRLRFEIDRTRTPTRLTVQEALFDPKGTKLLTTVPF